MWHQHTKQEHVRTWLLAYSTPTQLLHFLLSQNIIKIAVKVAVLIKNEQFSRNETSKLAQFQQRFRVVAMTLIRYV